MKTKFRKSARFWTWWRDGWVKLTLKDGEGCMLRYSCQTDEGFHFEEEHYFFECGVVHNHNIDGGRDYFGPIERSQRYYCYLRDLKAKPEAMGILRHNTDWTPARPIWTKEGRGLQRDA